MNLNCCRSVLCPRASAKFNKAYNLSNDTCSTVVTIISILEPEAKKQANDTIVHLRKDERDSNSPWIIRLGAEW